jgi:hypothetical protein
MMAPRTPTALLRQRLFSLWADAAQALANGDPINTADVHAEADAIINAAFAAQARQLEDRRRIATSFRRRR